MHTKIYRASSHRRRMILCCSICLLSFQLSAQTRDTIPENKKNNIPQSIRFNNKDTVKNKEISGIVMTATGSKVANVSISYLNKEHIFQTVNKSDSNGFFLIHIPINATVLKFDDINFKERIVELKQGKFDDYEVELDASEKKLEDVVVNNGMFSRKIESFTGAATVISGEKLRTVANTNIIQALKSVDPSFIVLNNNLAGSDPNTLANIQIRGQSAINSSNVQSQFANQANLPLFILNGFATTLQQVTDLDINRIASITILKDAASTAVYGGKAANGVVVIETIRPKAGALRVNLSNDQTFDMADLSGYNMMNSKQLLEFQSLSGYYTPSIVYPEMASTTASFINNEALYERHAKAVLNGVNSYWLNVPLRNIGLMEANSISVNGGSSNFQFDLGGNYKTTSGLMKGSDRNVWNGNLNITYRLNKLIFSNSVFASGTNSAESPYGNFSSYVNIAPYYRKYRDDGSLNTDRYFEQFNISSVTSFGGTYDYNNTNVANPLYNATLNSITKSSQYSVWDNLGLIWDISNSFRFQVQGQIRKMHQSSVAFLSPDNTSFDSYATDQKGSYTNTLNDELYYNSNATLTYNKVLNKIHSLTGNIRTEIESTNNESTAFSAVGFPTGTPANPYYATQYAVNSKPTYSKETARNLNMLGSFNYTYNNKYYVDLSYRKQGSSIFGSANKYSDYGSVGVGWNINKENFLSQSNTISLLRYRINYGVTGNQNASQYSSNTVYTLEQTLNLYGVGYYINSLGVPYLKPANNKQLSMGLDINLWNDRFNAVLNYYYKKTDPLIISGQLAPSAGVSTTYLNAGSLAYKGQEWTINYSPIYKKDKNIIWTIGIMGSHYKGKYANVESSLSKQNDKISSSLTAAYNLTSPLSETQLQQYKDGYSPDDLWAVRSLGIDPETGRELFMTKDGKATYNYNSQDVVRIGSSQPTVQGVISTSLNLNGFQLSAYIRYSLGGYIINSALYDKVENISFNQLVYNQDVRALTSRWKNPGDQALFKGLAYANSYTQLSSRFLQKENYLSGESISVAYEFRNNRFNFLNKIGASTLRLRVYATDIFRSSNIRAERGIDYPFSRNIATSINIFF